VSAQTIPEGQAMVGRLALRQEGDMWVAYYAHPKTMDLAVVIGTILLVAVETNPARKEAWMSMMWEIVADTIEGLTGHRPKRLDRPAPEHERGVRP
jgi:hypothetical protein